MATPVIMPKQGQSVETCIITRWFRQKGESVRAGDILLSYETDKASFDLESPSDGIVLDILYDEGTEVPVLENVAVLGEPGEIWSDHGTVRDETEQVTPVPKPEIAGEKGNKNKASLISVDIPSRIRISPRARRLAESKNVKYDSLSGTGPNGRIICSDIEVILTDSSAGAGSPYAEANGFSDQPLSNIRKLIARSMQASLQNSAQLTHHMSADARKLLEARKRVKADLAKGEGKQDITLNDMICFCVIRALSKFPAANSHFLDDSIRTFHGINLGIAVDTPRGLMVPAVRNAHKMDLTALSVSLRSVTESCRQGNIDPELLKSTAASFTVSNLGNYGVEMFTPVINLPQVAILGVCTIINRPADLGNNTFGFIPVLGLSLTYDHRAIDGGPASLFLREIKDQVEKFEY
jgi:pyruvate dehydrogenase E2 component (dihydrolipoamide acetyltransferase)